MTSLSSSGIASRCQPLMESPRQLALSDLTLVIPVKNDQQGMERLLDACLAVFAPDQCPAAIVIIDTLSHPPLSIPSKYRTWGLPVHLLVCVRSGTAAARNMGVRSATTSWVLFLESTNLLTPGLIEGYRQALDGSVGYAGVTRAAGDDLLSRSYDTQGILNPPSTSDAQDRPAYLMTANMLVWRPAFLDCGGFDERLRSSEREAVDLGLRLWERGTLAYAPSAQVFQACDATVVSFVRRCVRYEQGKRSLAARQRVHPAPRPFAPFHSRPIIHLCTTLLTAVSWHGSPLHRSRPQDDPFTLASRERTGFAPEDSEQKALVPFGHVVPGVVVVIDGDCISPRWITQIASLLRELGPITQAIVCCKATAALGWKEAQTQVHWPMEVVINANADGFLAKTVDELLRSNAARTFCLVTNDKDFVRVVRQIKAAGGTVWGLGAPNAAATFQKACDRFIAFSVPTKKK